MNKSFANNLTIFYIKYCLDKNGWNNHELLQIARPIVIDALAIP